MPEFKLSSENYYSREAARAYYSASQVKQFFECSSAAMADLNGDYVRKKTPALLVGGYIDAHFAGEIDEFKKANPEIFTKTGTLRSDYAKAEEIIDRIERDELACALMSGEKQKIVTGKIGGLLFKAKLDVWHDAEAAHRIAKEYAGMSDLTFADGCIVDLKVMKDFEPMFRQEEGRLSFVEYWRYDLQMAIYQELMSQKMGSKVPCYILAASKQDPPDLTLVQIPQELLDFNLKWLTDRLPDINLVKTGEEEPESCGKCAWCRQSKKLDGPTLPGTLLWA